jgi:hypothetical protein
LQVNIVVLVRSLTALIREQLNESVCVRKGRGVLDQFKEPMVVYTEDAGREILTNIDSKNIRGTIFEVEKCN